MKTLDLQDILDLVFSKDFNYFLEKTSGILHLKDMNDNVTNIFINSPADLIYYYDNDFIYMKHIEVDGNKQLYIQLENKSKIDKEIDLIHTLNRKYGNEKFQPFLLYNILEKELNKLQLQEAESLKDKENQIIYGK